ncbi:MAG: flagellar protein FliT [Porticoccaceae bacterium]
MSALKQEQLPPLHAGQCRDLASALTLTQRMLELARENDWAPVSELETQRREHLSGCFDFRGVAADSALIAEAVAALLHLNEELMSLLKTARSEVMDQGRQFALKRKAADSYGLTKMTRL